ncbi:MAG TPA: dTDP-4-amino-4,6-dideoxygalactose transaminase [Steroidobacteraceae bacterium]|nr:dTDP-4-amino-4,6-dideoxygalactose transaminase [Steroidobacteraceae bacterium]
MSVTVPLCRPFLTGNETKYVAESIASGQLAGDGPFTKRCERLMEEAFGARRVLLTTSGTSALEMAAFLCDLHPGDHVIMPSYTFTSTANAFLLRGAQPVFVDIEAETLNLDVAAASAAVTDRTRVIVPVHYAGIACDMKGIGEIAARHRLMVVEDAAQAVNATYHDRKLGTIGDFGAFSFHQTKNFVCGEGGALVIGREQAIERAEIVREKGTDRSRFFRGQVDKYTWVDAGSSYVPSDLLAAFLLAQLESMDVITAQRARVFKAYEELFAPLVERGIVTLPAIPAGCVTNYHIMYAIVESAEQRTALLHRLNERGFGAVFHYVPLHLSPMGARLGYRPGMLPVTERLSERLIRLPLYPELDHATIAAIVGEIARFFAV